MITSARPLVLVQEIPLDNDIVGRLDHLTISKKHIYLSCLGNDTVEVIDVFKGRTVSRLTQEFSSPQGLLYIEEVQKLYVGTAGGKIEVFSEDLSHLKTLELDECDNLRYCTHSKQIFVGCGEDASSAIVIIDIYTDTFSELKYNLKSHPEGFQLESNGNRIFVNAADENSVVVIDRQSGAVTEYALASDQGTNFPMCIDEATQVIFIGLRKPPALNVLDMNSGDVLASLPCCADTDDIFFDATRKRVYAIGGDGTISIFQQQSRELYEDLGAVDTAVGARTGMWHSKRDRLYVAAPKTSAFGARILVYSPTR